MRITLYEPIVSPIEDFYKLTASDETVRIHVGFTSPGTNIVNIWSERRWYVRDTSGMAVHSGKVDVKLNTFETHIDITGLEMGCIFSFCIENPDQGTVSSATISTIESIESVVGLVNETSCFTNRPETVGDIELYSFVKASTGIVYWRVRFPKDWVTTRNTGNAIILGILEGTNEVKPYAYAPTVIYTYNRSVPSVVQFSPFQGMPYVDVPVRQLPVVKYVGNGCYSVDPPTKLCVEWKMSLYDGEMRKFVSAGKLAVLNVRDFASGRVASIGISSVYEDGG